jgi:hypothetical protein
MISAISKSMMSSWPLGLIRRQEAVGRSPFHAYLLSLPDINFVGHTHATYINQILCSPRAADFAAMKPSARFHGKAVVREFREYVSFPQGF